MADGRDEATAYGVRKSYPWTEIFRCFHIAIDPRKLLVAAVGILVMSFGWYVLSMIFATDKPLMDAPEYTNRELIARTLGAKKLDNTEYTPEEYAAEGKRLYERDLTRWKTLDELAGNKGIFSSLPWYEERGPNPYLYLTQIAGSPSATWGESSLGYIVKQMPILAEPLVKLLLPIVKIVDSNSSPLTRIYLLLILLWNLAVWAFFGGIITRMAAVQLSNKDRISLMQAVGYVRKRYVSYILAPLLPLAIVGVVIIGLGFVGMLALIPIVGDFLIYGLGTPLIILGGLVMAIFLIGLVGYPLMYTTLSVEGSDTFDAFSRAYNYVFGAPWQYLWYAFVAIVYGAAVTFFVVMMGSLMVYLAKWSISQAPLNETTNQQPVYLFRYAPESFGWKELLLKGSKLELEKSIVAKEGRTIIQYVDKDPVAAEAYRNSYTWFNKVGAWLVTFWLVLIFMMMLGFSYSFFWCASTVIYLLMRRKVDQVELDEIYLEDAEMDNGPPIPPMPPMPTATATTTSGSMSLPVVPPSPPVPPVAMTPPVVMTPPVPPVVMTPPVPPVPLPPIAVTPPTPIVPPLDIKPVEPPKTDPTDDM